MCPIEVETGPMFSGKSKALIHHLENHRVMEHQLGVDYLAFNHSSDNRYGKGHIAAHNGQKYECLQANTAQDILETIFNIYLTPQRETIYEIKPELIGLKGLYLEEGQFFDANIAQVLEFIDDSYRNHPDRHDPLLIVIAGLDMDFRGEPFDPMPDIIAKAEIVHKHKAVCKVCNKANATRTQRIVNGQPADYHDPIILVGAQESYTARCPNHHEVPNKPKPKNNQP